MMFTQQKKVPLAELWPACVWRLCSIAIGFETLLVDDERVHSTCCSFELLLLMALLTKNDSAEEMTDTSRRRSVNI